MESYEVVYTVKYVTTVNVEPGETLGDKITDIKIPESQESSYVDDSFEIEEVRDQHGKRVSSRNY